METLYSLRIWLRKKQSKFFNDRDKQTEDKTNMQVSTRHNRLRNTVEHSVTK